MFEFFLFWKLVDLKSLEDPIVPILDKLRRSVEKPCQDHPDQADQHQENCQHAEQDHDVPVADGEGDVAVGVVGGGGALPVQGDPHLTHG